MLSFGEAIQANQSMDSDPDWVITINGQDVGQWVMEWELIDDEQDQSQIRVVLANPDLVNSGKFDYGQDMEIRFGYKGLLGPKAYLPVAQIKERYPAPGELTIEVIGRDETSKLSGGNNKGNHGNESDENVLKKILESRGLKMGGDAKGVKDGCRYGLMNENDRAACYRLGNCCKKGAK
jgi:phage protein D